MNNKRNLRVVDKEPDKKVTKRVKQDKEEVKFEKK